MSIKVFAKKLFFFLMCLFLVPIFAACGNNKKNDESNKSNVGNSSVENKTETKKANLSLVGEWKSADEKVPSHEATITKNKIVIRWVNHKDNIEALTKELEREGKKYKVDIVEALSEEELKQKMTYWVGTYKEPENSEDEYAWTSSADKDAMKNSSMSAKNEDSKEFKYSDDVLSYKITVPGTSTIKEIKLKKA